MTSSVKPLLLSLSLTLGFLGFHGCQTVPTPPAPADTKSGPVLSASELDFKGRIEAQAQAASYAAKTLPDSNEKVAVQGPIDVIVTQTAGTATQKQKDDAMIPVMLALKGDLDKANANWAAARMDASETRTKLAELQAQVVKERVEAAAELTRQLQQARDEATKAAEAQTRKIVCIIFFGGGFLLLLATAGVFYFSATVPQLGPRVAIFTGGAGGASIATGIAVLTLLNHPAVVWWGLGIVVALVGMAMVAIWYNHLHAVDSGQIIINPKPAPVVVAPQAPAPVVVAQP